METLDGTEWDVVISGTGLSPSLLALALSRSGKRILHLDRNDHYGGNQAALSLTEAEHWASQRSQQDHSAAFSHAAVSKPEASDHHDAGKSKLSPSRAYSIGLAPQLLYARSNLLDALVSSRAHNQLDFQAVGSWFIVDRSTSSPKLTRVPSGREDVFEDTSLNLKAKRALMKFLRFVASYEDHPDTWHKFEDLPFTSFLEDAFALPPSSHALILALTLSPCSSASTATKYALPGMARYLRSIGIFGPGFGSVMPKWGGLAEVAQVSCRACAVGGGVYVLNKSVQEVGSKGDSGTLTLKLGDGEKVSTTWLCGEQDDLPATAFRGSRDESSTALLSRSVSIASSPLATLFPPTSEGGVTPAGAVVVVPGTELTDPPVHLFVHTADAGECPMTQSVIYGSIALPTDAGFRILEDAIERLLESVGEQPAPSILWTLKYQQRSTKVPQAMVANDDGILLLPELSQDLALNDSVIDEVKSAWSRITGETSAFMKFETREGLEEDDTLN